MECIIYNSTFEDINTSDGGLISVVRAEELKLEINNSSFKNIRTEENGGILTTVREDIAKKIAGIYSISIQSITIIGSNFNDFISLDNFEKDCKCNCVSDYVQVGFLIYII
jgi:hypothetical protein